MSLYVPSMFNHHDCALKLVKLFCYDNDRFFLILDTTIKLQSSQPQAMAAPPASKAGSRRTSQSFGHGDRGAVLARTAALNKAAPLQHGHQQQQLASKLNMVEELQSRSKSSERCGQERQELQRCESADRFQSRPTSGAQLKPTALRRNSAHIGLRGSGLSALASHSDEPGCSPIQASQGQAGEPAAATSLATGGGSSTTRSSSFSGYPSLDGLLGAGPTSAAHQSPVSQNGLSLEEPRSMSTFVDHLDQANNVILGRARDLSLGDPGGRSSARGPMRRLDFRQQPGERSAGFEALKLLSRRQEEQRRRRRHRSMVNLSESTAVTCDDTSMPTWVRNEYIQQQLLANSNLQSAGDGSDLLQQLDDKVSPPPPSTGSSSGSSLHSSWQSASSASLAAASSTSTDEQTVASTMVGSRQEVYASPSCERQDFTRQAFQFSNRRHTQPAAIGATAAGSWKSLQETAGLFGPSGANNQAKSRSQPELYNFSLSERDGPGGGGRCLFGENLIDCHIYQASRSPVCVDEQEVEARGATSSSLTSASNGGLAEAFTRQAESRLAEQQLEAGDYRLGPLMQELREEETEAPAERPNQLTGQRPALGMGERYSSSCVDVRDTSAEVTMIEMADRRLAGSPGTGAEAQGSGKQRGLGAVAIGPTVQLLGARGRRLSLSQNLFGRRDTSRSRKGNENPLKEGSRSSLNSIRKSLMRIFC